MKKEYAPGLVVEWTDKEWAKIKEINRRGMRDIAEGAHRQSMGVLPYLSLCLGISEASIKKALKGYGVGMGTGNHDFNTYGNNKEGE